MRIRVLDQAEIDLVAGFRFYEEQRKGLGDYFLDSLYSEIDSLILFSGRHRVVSGYHRLLARNFPYAVYYKSFPDRVEVWAVLDCRRNPAWTRRRLNPGKPR